MAKICGRNNEIVGLFAENSNNHRCFQVGWLCAAQIALNLYKERNWHIKDNGVFPNALVTMKKPDGVSLIDGNHRMAAFEMVQSLTNAQFVQANMQRPSRDQDVWLGTHSDGEVPDG